MTREQILKTWPNASESTIRANLDTPVRQVEAGQPKQPALRPLDKGVLTTKVDDNTLESDMSKLTISNERLLEEYSSVKSVHALGAKYGVSGQCIHNRLRAVGCVALEQRFWTDEQEQKLIEYYKKNVTAEDFSSKEIAAKLGKTLASVEIKAGRLRLTNGFRRRPRKTQTKQQAKRARIEAFNALPETDKKQIISARRKSAIAKFGHPRGMLGKHHSQDAKDAVSRFNLGKKIPAEQKIRTLKTNLERYGVSVASNVNGRHASWKAQWAVVGGQRFFARSSWEVNYARFLEWRKQQGEIIEWKHEPKTFWFEGVKRGCVSYKPDFEVALPSGKTEYHEVKGWMDARSKTVLNRMRIYHPQVAVVLIDAKRYKAIMRTAGAISETLGLDDGDKRIRFEYGQCETRGEEGVIVKIESVK